MTNESNTMSTDDLLKMHVDLLTGGTSDSDWVPYDERLSLSFDSSDRVSYVEALTDCWSLVITDEGSKQIDVLRALKDAILAARHSGSAYPLVVLENDLSELVKNKCLSAGLEVIDQAIECSKGDVNQELRSLKDHILALDS